MLDIQFIRDHVDEVKTGVINKNGNPAIVDEVLKLDIKRRELTTHIQAIREKRNKLNEDLKKARTDELISQSQLLKQELQKLEPELNQVDSEYFVKLMQIPNLPAADVPVAKDESGNREIRKWGTPNQFNFPIKDHIELGRTLNILDFETGAKVTGSQFFYLYNAGALLELALVQYAMQKLSKVGFTPVITPDLAKSRFYLGTGYAPKGNEAQTYTIEGQDLGLIATAEVTLAGKHADEVISAQNLPIKYVGYSHCFRQESGAYGKYSKGLYRVHQFTKVEMFIYCLPEDSNKFHQEILHFEEEIYQELGLPYRVVEMCTGDLGAMATKKFDIEAWMPSRNDYGEVTSTSNCTDYQARNLNIRYKDSKGVNSTGFVHMLNGTALVSSRVPLAILENYQQADGTVLIPAVLQPFCGFNLIVAK
jgi:seryl-tRNA synthetase